MDLQTHLQNQMLSLLEEPKPEPKPEPKQVLINGYGIDNPYVFNLITSTTKCWGKWSSKEDTCIDCPLSSLCESHTILTKENNKEQRDLNKDLKKWFSDHSVDIKNIKLNKDASVKTGNPFTALSDTTCIITGLYITEFDECVIIERCGIVHVKVFEYLNNK